MASLIPVLFLNIIYFLYLSTPLVNGQAPSESPSASSSPSCTGPPGLQKICKITRFPDLCASSLTNVPAEPSGSNIDEFVVSAINSTIVNTHTAIDMVTKIKDSAGNNQNLTVICTNCLEELEVTISRLESSINGMPSDTKEVRAGMSSARFCLQIFENVNDTVEIKNLVSFLEKVNMMNSNAFSILWNMIEKKTDADHWTVPKTERNGFFGQFDSNPKDLTPELSDDRFLDPQIVSETVSKTGEGFRTVQEAVDKAPFNLTDKLFVIHINAGVYDEKVTIKFRKTNIVLIGDGIGKTIITGKVDGGAGMSTINSNFEVIGDYFQAKHITFKTTGFKSNSDRSFIEKCEFIGHQGTFNSYAGRQVYKSCRIEGNNNFIFGNGAAIFQNCEIFVNPRIENPKKDEKNAITAQGRTDPVQETGFVFNNCTITGTPEYMKLFKSDPSKYKIFLGRPLGEFARTVFINSSLDSIIDPAGWTERERNNSLSTIYFGELKNKGPGSDLKGRVSWSSQIPAKDVVKYSMSNFIQGDGWLPKF